MFDINHNEGGRGLIYALKWKPFFLYVAYWTKGICPRIVVANKKLSITFNP